MLLAALAFIIGCGTLLLSLPQAQATSVSFLDVLFTTVSTVCVTGLKTVPIESFSYFGHCVLLVLMQIGGLGLMTFSFFFASLFMNMGMTRKLMAGKIFEFESWAHIRSFLSVIVLVTLFLEGVGAALLYVPFCKVMPKGNALFYAIFHSVSAFCNAGVTLFSGGMKLFTNNPLVLLTLSFLVISGGIGFIVWYELARAFRVGISAVRGQGKPLFTYSLHTRLAVATTLLLIVFGTICIWGIEQNHALGDMRGLYSILNAFFMSVSMRSAGFMVMAVSHLRSATVLILLALMFVGGSPGSTASGIKTTTFALFCATIRAIIQNRDAVEISGRTIPTDQMYKVIAVMVIALSWIIATTFFLLVLHPDAPFLSVLLEVVSAFSTCGISLGLTAKIASAAKIILMGTMIVGRMGLLTLVMALRRTGQKHLYRYPEERVLLT